jgi:phosphoenolpyruvate carboxylase
MLLSSSKTSDYDKISRDIQFLIQCLREVLEEVGEQALADALPWQEGVIPGSLPDTTHMIQLHSIAFQLLNAVEENAVVQYRRQLESHDQVAYFSGLWSQTLHFLRDNGLTEDQVLDVLARTRVEPVLTAHPTEAKRFSVLEQHRNLYLLLVKLENQIYTPQEQREIRDEIKLGLERLWRTGEIYLEKPDVASEVRNVLYYLRNVFPRLIESLDRRLLQAWIEAGYDHQRQPDLAHLPRLSFGTWVGGDRDGHPFVTADVTRQTLLDLRRAALDLIRERLVALAQKLTLSMRLQITPPALQSHIAALSESFGARGKAALERNPDEPWRQYVNLLLARLPESSASDTSVHGLTYATASELAQDMQVLYDSLCSVSGQRLADADVLPIIRVIQTFGFHLAVLDIRQNSRFHDLAVAQLLTASSIDGADFPEWDEDRRLAFLNAELTTSRPFTLPGMALGPEADAVVNCYRVLAQHSARFGTDGLGALIVSMTRSVSDLLVVYLLAREGGLMTQTPGGLTCMLPVVPLFETIEDLNRSPDILRAFLAHPITQRSLDQRLVAGERVQQVMIGYSDSNKDGGIFASLWHLDQAQTLLARVGQEQSVRVRFFHGRGGSISRGAGPTHRFIRSVPGEALDGDLRLTEQGETIARKYANRLTATHNLELLLSGVARSAAQYRYLQPEARHGLEAVMTTLADDSYQTYRALLESPGFIDFYRQATPIDVIESSRIGSRPARRTGQRTLADLRAIPWVFSWSQSRFFLSGWYGVGTALERLRASRPDDFALLQASAFDSPQLHYIISSVASNLMLADAGLMRRYADLVADEAVRESILEHILDELERTRTLFEVIYGGPLVERRPNVSQIIRLRREPLATLHAQQIDLLRRWRQLAADDPQAESILLQLLLSVNAIANGLGTTG